MTIFELASGVAIVAMIGFGWDGWRLGGAAGSLVGMGLGAVWCLVCRLGFKTAFWLARLQEAVRPGPVAAWCRAWGNSMVCVLVLAFILWVFAAFAGANLLLEHLFKARIDSARFEPASPSPPRGAMHALAPVHHTVDADLATDDVVHDTVVAHAQLPEPVE